MQLPINISWDLSVKVHVAITHMAITDMDISNEKVNPVPVELLNYDLVVPYPLARNLMEKLSEIVCSHPKGLKLYDSKGQVYLDLETGELYPKNGEQINE